MNFSAVTQFTIHAICILYCTVCVCAGFERVYKAKKREERKSDGIEEKPTKVSIHYNYIGVYNLTS